jgi:hypothetical protein
MAVSMNSRWLYFQVHGRKPARRSPRRSSGRGPTRCSKFKAWIRTMACACCGSIYQVEAAHTGDDGGAAQKASDYSCIPLCADCHTLAARSYHRDREACEERIFARLGLTIAQLVRKLNQEWKLGKEQAA